MIWRIHLILPFVESCLSRLITVPIIPVRKTIIIICFALCGALWLLLVLSARLRFLWFVATSGPDVGFLCACVVRCGRFSLSVSGGPTGRWTGYATFLSVVLRMVSALHRLMFCTAAINANNRLWGWGRRRFWGCPTHVGSM